LIPKGEVDVLLGFEPLEALRAATKYAGDRTVAVVSVMPVLPSNVTSGDAVYPKIDDIERDLESICKQVHLLDTEPVLTRSGSTRVLNSYMIGVLSVLEDIPVNSKNLKQAISKILDSEKDLNVFDEGPKALS
jgi:indolepyruvate ferredoxin oxidoreductase beta subunit